MALRDQILEILIGADAQKVLADTISPPTLPALAEAIEPYLARCQVKSFAATVVVIAKNFNQDGPRVLVLLDQTHPQHNEQWSQIQAYVTHLTQKKWPTLEPYHQQEIVSKTLVRIHRGLPGFCFLSRLETWIHKICVNVYLSYIKEVIKHKTIETSLEEEVAAGVTLGERLSSPSPDLEDEFGKQDIEKRLLRLTKLVDNSLGVKILRLHLAGYTLEEIKQELGGGLSVPTISRRLKAIKARIKQDAQMKGSIGNYSGRSA
jgi:DNA-directed RNA polymerase specialized sigma24 family protein